MRRRSRSRGPDAGVLGGAEADSSDPATGGACDEPRGCRDRSALGLLRPDSAPAGCAPAAELSAAEIVAKNVAARGGLDAWRKVETMVWIGHIESAHAPMPSMQFELEQKRPNKTRLQISALGDKSVRVFDGAHGWKVRPASGRPEAEPYTPQELKSAQAGHGIDGPLIDCAAKGNSVTLGERRRDRRTQGLSPERAPGEGRQRARLGRRGDLSRPPLRPDGRRPDGCAAAGVGDATATTRHVEGLQIPFLITTGGGPGTTPDKMQIERVVLNAPLDDSRFGNPAAAALRNRVRPSLVPQAPAPTAVGRTDRGERGAGIRAAMSAWRLALAGACLLLRGSRRPAGRRRLRGGRRRAVHLPARRTGLRGAARGDPRGRRRGHDRCGCCLRELPPAQRPRFGRRRRCRSRRSRANTCSIRAPTMPASPRCRTSRACTAIAIRTPTRRSRGRSARASTRRAGRSAT